MIGTTLSHFKITAKLGEGGMGAVYRAEDTKLDREVAIKVLPEAVSQDPERLARFQREAKVLASLNHSNIAGIHQVEQAEGVHFLVMELVEGEDLAERIARGAIPVDDALPIAQQITEALEVAHERGIIHRDLKPANVKVTPEGQVKVLDFGLAKALEPQGAAGTDGNPMISPSLSPTLTAQMTGVGVILGTAAYMSPEQARGGEADRRSDIWAFGMILAEMLTGKAVFNEPTVSDTLAAVLKSDPDLSGMPDDLPPQLLRLIRRCLRKDPRDRLRDIGDVGLDLREIAAGDSDLGTQSTATETAVSTGSRWLPLLLGLAIGLVVAFVGIKLLAPAQEPDRAGIELLQFTIPAPEGSVLERGLDISPDGSRIAFLARDEESQSMIWVRSLDSLESQPVGGTEGARFPFWSPDGKKLAFFAGTELKIVDLIGTPPKSLVRVASAPDVRGGTWGLDGTIAYAPTFRGGLMQIPATGGEATPATEVDPEGRIGTHRFPSFLPDGKHFVTYASRGTGTEPGEILLGQLGSLATRSLTQASSTPVFAGPDQLVFALGDVLVAQTLDLERLELVGDPVPLGVTLPGGLAVSGSRSLSASETGTLVYRTESFSWSELVWVSRDGSELGILGSEATWHYAPRISPDGKKVAVARYAADTNGGDIWVYDRARNLGSQVVAEAGDEDLPTWSPDGQRLAFSRTVGAGVTLHTVELGVVGSERLVHDGDPAVYIHDWMKDGSGIVGVTISSTDAYAGVVVASDQSDTPPKPLVVTGNSEWNLNLSPDGRWVAFTSDATGQNEVYVRSFEGTEAPWRVSTAGGRDPCFSRDGKELYFVAPDEHIHAAQVVADEIFTTQTPVPLFEARLDRTSFDRQYDVAPDGTFLLNRRGEDTDEPITVVMGMSKLLEQ